MKEKVEKVIEEEIAPKLRADGGDIELVDIDEGNVKVKLKGSCAGCPMSQITMTNTVEKYLKSNVPGVESVESV